MLVERMKVNKPDSRVLKIVRIPQGKRYTTGLNLKGDYLLKYGFDFGDMVNISFENGKILITKID